MSTKTKNLYFFGFIGFCLVVLLSTALINYRGMMDSTRILEDTIQRQVISITSAARAFIDERDFYGYNKPEDINNINYRAQLTSLRRLSFNTEAAYIYALKKVDGQNVFIFDTDDEDEPFTVYDQTADVIELAFAGTSSAGISNLVDEYGSFCTGAMPIELSGQVIGVICVDVPDDVLVRHRQSGMRNFSFMLIIMVLLMGASSVLVYNMIGRIKGMQDRLSRMANYDKLTNLPNRQHLMDTLSTITSKRPRTPFALFFVDLDNFKQVNDNAGHDAGDALLKNIGQYLENAPQKSTTFRVGAGMLNVAARIGGDEFILIVPSIATEAEAADVAKDLLSGFAKQGIDRYIEKYHVGLSIGAALYPFHSTDYNVLIKYADIAMYHAKHKGKNDYRIYQDELEDKNQK